MQTIKFRLQNFKTVYDTDWINCGNIPVFVGISECGKSSISKLKSLNNYS
jgi:AAA15 family ATPase/GTPase